MASKLGLACFLFAFMRHGLELALTPRTLSRVLKGSDEAEVDLVFVLDASKGVMDTNFLQRKDFVIDFVQTADIDNGNVRVGVVIYGTEVHVQFHLNTHRSQADVIEDINNIPYSHGNTNTADALRTMREEMFTPANGDRPDVPNIAVLVTDGMYDISFQPTGPEADQAQGVSIHIYAIGIGLTDTTELDGIASKPVRKKRSFFIDPIKYYSEGGKVMATIGFRLAGTHRTSQAMGRVEMMIWETWRAVCDARVICRQLGYPSNAAVHLSRSSLGPSQAKGVLLVDFSCTGNESTIFRCPNVLHEYSENCNTEELSVLCTSTHLYILIETNETGRVYPLVEGTPVTLKCESTRLDLTAANYTWPETGGARPSGEYLVFDNVSRAHHGRRVRCAASYQHSGSTQLVSSEPLIMQVYYDPALRVTSGVDTCLLQRTDLTLCVVTRNQNVTLVCEADSNPPPTSTLWSGKINSRGQILHIISAHPTTHDGPYTCTVNNTPADGDRRLSFVSSHQFSVIVQYPPTELKFRVNGLDNRTMTVAENTEDVKLLCQATGRPSPRVRVINNTDDKLLGGQPQEDIQSTKIIAKVSFSIRKIQCAASGSYTCTADNGLGRAIQNITLLVLCAPKRKNVENQPPVLSISKSKPQLNVEMTAYPTPVLKSYQGFRDNDSEKNESASVEDRIHAVCTARNSVSALVTCSISVVNVTEADEGVYQIVFTNGLGDLPFNFTVTRDDFVE